ncbi:calcium-binding protein [Microvirga alba]|uniref:Calcium-binding protein n=1 Tax=Microvirga alba TaxID=2791025 RepID=A0A931FRR0_9HYPH|nr:calcium-binding protein [Microvirga alba]MBF9233001.1 calcium-binding protein [Microvirga alba]
MAVRTAGTVGYGGHDLDSLTFEPKQYISNAASDRIIAGNGPNDLYGNNGNDTLYGKGGDDLLCGGAGRDVLYGGKGADYFLFDRAPGGNNIDRIMDFSHKQGDRILLAYKHFNAVDLVLKTDTFGRTEKDGRLNLPIGHLAEEQFRLGPTALSEKDRIIYDQTTGTLSYDRDGSGVEAAVTIATLKAGTALSWSDFLFF